VDSQSQSHPMRKPSHTVKTIDSAKLCYCPVCEQGILTEPRSGMMCGHSTKDISKRKLTLSRRAHPAWISALTELSKAWTASELGFSTRSSDSPMHLDLNSYSWRMSAGSSKMVSNKLQVKFPDSAMIVDGQLYPLERLAARSHVPAGLCLPTLTATDATAGAVIGKMDIYTVTSNGSVVRETKSGQKTSLTLGRYVQLVPKGMTLRPGSRIKPYQRGKLNPIFCEWLQGYPANWTELGHLETAWYLSKHASHSRYFQVSKSGIRPPKQISDARKLPHDVQREVRFGVLRLLNSGESPEVVGKIIGVSTRSVYRWQKAFIKQGGWTGLEARKKGRPATLTPKELNYLKDNFIGTAKDLVHAVSSIFGKNITVVTARRIARTGAMTLKSGL